MKGRGNWMQKLAEGMELPAESMPGLPLVEIAGDRRVLVENHGGGCWWKIMEACVSMARSRFAYG